MKTGKTVVGCRSVTNGDNAAMRKPHFLKIIVPPLLTHGKGLRIPPKFANEYRKRMSNPVRLMVSTGAIWEVELGKDKESNLWLLEGWLEFARFFSIQYGHFLVFQYEGDGSLFRVFIFDITGAEIEYNIDGGSMRVETDEDKRRDSSDTQMEEEDEEDDSDMQIVDGQYAIVPFEKDDVSVIQIEDDDEDEKDENYSDDDDDEVPAPHQPAIVRAWQFRVDLSAVAAALMECGSCGSLPSFIVTVPGSAVKNSFNMTIPSKHYTEYLKVQAPEKLVFLQIADDDDGDDGVSMMWPVKYTVRKAKSRASLATGIKAFTLHHSIRVGDICLFQLLRPSPPTPLYKVTVLKNQSSM